MSAEQLPPEAQSHYEDPYHQGSCEHPTHMVECQWDEWGALCFELTVDHQGRMIEAWFDGDGEPWLLASASVLVQSIEGQLLDDVLEWPATRHLQRCESDDQRARAIWRAPFDRLCERLRALADDELDDEELDDDDEGSVFRGPHLGEEC